MAIPVNEPLLGGNEKKYLNQCIDTGWISSEGPFVKQLEQQFAEFSGVQYGCAVANGTAALETALYALGVEAGDEVIMPSFTIMSCAVACLRLGAVPVLVDIDPEIWCMDTSEIEAMITPKTKVVMPVHIYGHPVDMDKIFELRKKYGFKILEDASEVHGAEYYSAQSGKWLKCGAMGDAATFSFYANKIITTGEGGIVVTNDEQIAERAKSYRNLCFGEVERFKHRDLGYNFRMTNLQAAVGVAQLEQVDKFLAIKRARGKYYAEKLAAINGIRFMPVKDWARSVYWMFSVELSKDSGFTAVEVMSKLRELKIGTRPFFMGLHAQPALQKLGLFKDKSYPNTEFAYKYGFYLPSGMTLTNEQIDTVVDSIKKVLNREI
jgi:perosamine synthetase